MPTLSVVMIVKNEAACLGECLESLGGIADEIVVGDTGSTDDTPAIAEWYRARVLPIPWHDDFSEARNLVLAEATGDWVLHLDADEILDPESAGRIRALVDADGAGADAIEITLANYCNDPRAWRWTPCRPDAPFARGHAGYIAVGLLRLFRNRRGFEYREPVHENITESVHEKGGVVRAEPLLIHHYGYTSSEAGCPKALIYLNIERRKVSEHPQDPKAWHDLAEQLLALNRADEAERACRTALSLDPRNVPAATSLANLLCNRGDLDGARLLFEPFAREGTALPHMFMTLGAIACRQGRLEDARLHLEAALAVAPESIISRLCYARALDLLGDPFAARQQLQAAAGVAPGLSEVRERLQAHERRMDGERALRSQRAREALNMLVDALRLDPEDPLIHYALGQALSALGRAERAEQSFDRARRLAPVFHTPH